MPEPYKKTEHAPQAQGSWRGESPIILAIDETTSPPRVIETEKKAIIIGSANDCDIIIKDPYISRMHCRIIRDGSTLLLNDLESTNGTFLGKTKITKATLYGEETITLGQTKVRIRVQESAQRHKIKSLGRMVGESEAMQEFFASLEKLAKSEANICILGESGTGKELAAKTIHELSSKSKGPFVAVNCGAFPPSLIESQLFGYERGAFTGAVDSHQGFFEQANRGTLFLDEIGEMPLDLQSRLLRILEEKSLKRLGGKTEIKIDFRLITATHRDLKELVKNEKFRFDLFWRIYVAPLRIPPLSQRENDIKLLAKHFVKEFSSSAEPKSLTKGALDKLKNHRWPGNVRELRNVIQRSVLECSSPDVMEHHIYIEELSQDTSLNLEDVEKEKIITALKKCAGRRQATANLLGIARSTLCEKLKKYDIKKYA